MIIIIIYIQTNIARDSLKIKSHPSLAEHLEVVSAFYDFAVNTALCIVTDTLNRCHRVGEITGPDQLTELHLFYLQSTLQWLAVIVTQLVAQSILTSEVVCGSNPVIGKNLGILNVSCQLYWKDENKEKKRLGVAH